MQKVYGPYLRNDGRKHVIIINTDTGKRRTQSYPRYVMEQHLQRTLLDTETVDHINGDYTDDSIANLQLLSLADNIRKSSPTKEYLTLICKHCGTQFQRYAPQERRDAREGKDGPFCSRVCVGKVHHTGKVWYVQSDT